MPGPRTVRRRGRAGPALALSDLLDLVVRETVGRHEEVADG
ncbi:hypothetical protein OOK27_12550 [Streptomyces canus]|nr:hypothetical protein [Streptomyces canus]MCX5254988.1 hypothetical protein [Streptomyces canus]